MKMIAAITSALDHSYSLWNFSARIYIIISKSYPAILAKPRFEALDRLNTLNSQAVPTVRKTDFRTRKQAFWLC